MSRLRNRSSSRHGPSSAAREGNADGGGTTRFRGRACTAPPARITFPRETPCKELGLLGFVFLAHPPGWCLSQQEVSSEKGARLASSTLLRSQAATGPAVFLPPANPPRSPRGLLRSEGHRPAPDRGVHFLGVLLLRKDTHAGPQSRLSPPLAVRAQERGRKSFEGGAFLGTEWKTVSTAKTCQMTQEHT